jgi:hypothetical protein
MRPYDLSSKNIYEGKNKEKALLSIDVPVFQIELPELVWTSYLPIRRNPSGWPGVF